jgi:LacI family transcriptional regulator
VCGGPKENRLNMPTIKDVAALAGVSYTTVSHVINKTRAVSPETRERVERAIKELDFSPSMMARCLRLGETKTIGVISVASDDLFFSGILHGIQERSWSEGYGVFISYADICGSCSEDEGEAKDLQGGQSDSYYEAGAREESLIADFARRNIQGLIINSLQPDEALRKTIEALKTPCVLCERVIEGVNADCFAGDDYQGTTEAVDRLISLGHRRIGVVEGYGFESHTVKYRKKAWEDALARAGIPVDHSLERDGAYDPDQAYRVTAELLSLSEPPTAILYYSDLMAYAGMRAAADKGVRIPEELSVIGYDDLDLDDLFVPRLTSVNQDNARMGVEMMGRLIDRIANPDLPPETRIYPQRLVMRDSVGPVPKNRA